MYYLIFIYTSLCCTQVYSRRIGNITPMHLIYAKDNKSIFFKTAKFLIIFINYLLIRN